MANITLEEIENIILPMLNEDFDKNWDYILELMDKIDTAMDKYPTTYLELFEIRSGLEEMQRQLLGDVFAEKIITKF